MKTFLFILFIVLITILVIKKDNIISKLFNRNITLNHFICSYFGFAIFAAIIYASVDWFLFSQDNNNTKFLTVYFETTKTTGHIWDYLYFSIVTQLTIGYGDFSPNHPISQFIAISQGLLGTLYMGAFLYAVLNYSTKIKLEAIEIYIDENKEFSPLCLDIQLSKNDAINYENIEIILCANINGEKINLCKRNIKSLFNNKAFTLYINLNNHEREYIYMDDNKLRYHEIYSFQSGNDIDEELIDFEIVEITLFFRYTKGEFFSESVFTINAIEDFKKIISNEIRMRKIYL